MRIYATIAKLEFDAKGAQEDLLGATYFIMLQAADKFFEAAAPRVPIETGMARGSFLNMMQLLNANGLGHGVFMPTEPQKLNSEGKPLRYYHVTVGRGTRQAVYSQRGLPKTPATAQTLSTPIDQILTLKNQQWKLAYETRVAHFNANEYGRDWQAFVYGRRAMDAYLISPAVKEALPSLLSYLKISTLGSGRTNPYKNFNVRIQKKVK